MEPLGLLHDPDAIVALHTEDTVFHMHGGGDPAHGRPAVREAIVAIFSQSPNLRFDRKTVYFGEGHIVTEYEMCGTADGVSFACDGVDVFALATGASPVRTPTSTGGASKSSLDATPWLVATGVVSKCDSCRRGRPESHIPATPRSRYRRVV